MKALDLQADRAVAGRTTLGELRRLSYLSLFWLAARESLRVGRLWSQTVLAPVVSSLLFVVVFGLSLSGRIRHVSGFEYQVFILPGLVAMAMLTAAYANNSSSIASPRSSDFSCSGVPAATTRPRSTIASLDASRSASSR